LLRLSVSLLVGEEDLPHIGCLAAASPSSAPDGRRAPPAQEPQLLDDIENVSLMAA